jgi:hypothetical protein
LELEMSNNIKFKPDSYRGVAAVTPSDSTEVAFSGIYVGGAGNVAVETNDGTATFTAVPVGTILPVCAIKVLSTGTTATNLVGLK